MRFVRFGNCVLVTCWVGLLTTCALSQEAAKSPENPPGMAAGDATSANSFFQCCDGSLDSQTTVQIEKALRAPLKAAGLDFSETPLSNVIASLQDEYKIPIQLDLAAISEAGIQPDEPITINLRSTSLRSALRLMLQAHQLTYIVRDEVLQITTPEQADKTLTLCVYDVRDLVRADHEEDISRLVDAIVWCVGNQSWVHNGGPADVRALQPGILVIANTDAVQHQIATMLGAIRKVIHGSNLESGMPVGYRGGVGGYGMIQPASAGRGSEVSAEGAAGYGGGRQAMGGAEGGMHGEGGGVFGPPQNPFGEIQQTRPPMGRDLNQ